MEILEKVKSSLSKDVVDRVELEGCEIVVYEDAKKIIMGIIPEDAKVKDIKFEPERSLVIITAEKPGLVIGRGGETFKKIKEKTLWVPRIERVPEITSKIVRSIRNLLFTETKWRKTFLKKIGKNIFTERETNRDWVRMICLGGWREVGRSCFLIETPKSKLLVECGVNVGGSNQNRFPYLQVKEFDPSELDGIIVSHPHLDHCGMVPYLYEYGYDGPIYCTTPCLDLLTMLCLDYIDVLQRNGVQPPFTAKGVKEAVKHSITLDYDEVSDVGPDVRLTFQQAAHLLGSAQVHLHIGQGLHNIVYTGDLKFGGTRLFDPAFTNFQRIETLIIESTYGGPEDIMPHRHESEQQLMNIIEKTMERKGQVIIPSFAVGRAQEVMAILAGSKFEYPVFIDGMIWDATAIHTAYPEYLSRDMEREIFRGENPFMSEIFNRIKSSQEREKAWDEKPSVIISTSGMLSGGPVMEHLKALGEDKNNTLIFVGYQGEGTMGRRIQKGWKEIPLTVEGKTKTMKLELEVETIEGLSGHSDKNQLINFVHRLNSKPERILICHGDNTKPVNLARTLHKLFRVETAAPKNLETVRLR